MTFALCSIEPEICSYFFLLTCLNILTLWHLVYKNSNFIKKFPWNLGLQSCWNLYKEKVSVMILTEKALTMRQLAFIYYFVTFFIIFTHWWQRGKPFHRFTSVVSACLCCYKSVCEVSSTVCEEKRFNSGTHFRKHRSPTSGGPHYDYVSPFISVLDCFGLLSSSGIHSREDCELGWLQGNDLFEPLRYVHKGQNCIKWVVCGIDNVTNYTWHQFASNNGTREQKGTRQQSQWSLVAYVFLKILFFKPLNPTPL